MSLFYMIKLSFKIFYGMCRKDPKITINAWVSFLISVLMFFDEPSFDKGKIIYIFIFITLLFICLIINFVKFIPYYKCLKFIRDNSYSYGVLLPDYAIEYMYSIFRYDLLEELKDIDGINQVRRLNYHRLSMEAI